MNDINAHDATWAKTQNINHIFSLLSLQASKQFNRLKMENPPRNQTIMEWLKEQYNRLYEIWVPWLEDLYLKYFTKDNKLSYTTRGTSLPTRSLSYQQEITDKVALI
jgi:hypothetical protein